MFKFSFILITVLGLSVNLAAQQNNAETNKVNYNSNSNLNNNEMSTPTQDVRSSGYFRNQAADFEQQSKESPASAQAWLNFYKSSLYSFYNGSSKTITSTQQQELDDILNEMKNKVPGSFEYNIAAYLNGRHNTSLLPYLIKASELNSSNLDVVEQYVAYYAITGNDAKLKEYVTKHRKVSKYEAFIDEYAYNLLQSIDVNSVLFTHGVMDTYPVYNQQLSQKVNTGVEIVNIDYLNSEEYRKNISKKLGVTFSYSGNNYSAAFEIASKLKTTKSVYFSNAFSKTELKKHEKELSLQGLALKYGDITTDVPKAELLWGSAFKKTQLEKTNMVDDYAKKMANNYLPILLTVYKSYTAAGKTKDAQAAKALSTKIAKINGNEKQVSELFN
jgi:hypothetical protein